MDTSIVFAVKRDLSDQSNNGFTLKSPDCMKILLNCLQNLDKQVKELHILAWSNNEKHIKGEKHLSDLTESINFMTKKFDDYDKNRD